MPETTRFSAPYPAPYPAPGVRQLGAVNTLGIWTLYKKEVRRFLKVYWQTVAAPVITTLLFISVFMLALGKDRAAVDNIPYHLFLVPGLIMMSVMTNAFANTSSSIMVAKIQGNIVDVLMPPLGASELTFAFAMGGVTRGVFVATAAGFLIFLILPLSIAHWAAAIYFVFASSLLMALLGILGGIWAEKFDHMSAVSNFVITPLAFLSGTFYSIDRLPDPFRTLAGYNPFFYMIDGFRYGILGRSDGNVMVGAIVIATLCLLLWIAAWWAFRSGWRIKS